MPPPFINNLQTSFFLFLCSIDIFAYGLHIFCMFHQSMHYIVSNIFLFLDRLCKSPIFSLLYHIPFQDSLCSMDMVYIR